MRRSLRASQGSRGPPARAGVRPLRERVGRAGEAAALAHLREQGFRLLDRDWRARAGQIDIIAEDGDTLVLVEVKARRGTAFGLPQEAVDARKQRKLRTLLETYRRATGRQSRPCRIDVVGLLLDADLAVVSCDHIRDAVQGE